MKGKVYLVGAGPGDPDLLTVKALRLLRNADTVLYDELVSPEILDLIPRTTLLHNVGKRAGQKKVSQNEIHFLMIALAESGLQVVRLKSGDPLIFGRAGEEIEALRAAGIECEIVSGVTSVLGAAAQAQIPLTHRHLSSGLVLLTGQQARENESADWRKLAASGVTLAIYMPGHDYSDLAARLTEAGLAKSMPCAVISKATTPHQQIEVTTIGELRHVSILPAPVLLVVGEVVRFAADRVLDEIAAPRAGLDVAQTAAATHYSLQSTSAERDSAL